MLSVVPVFCNSIFLVLLIKQSVFMQKKCAIVSNRMAKNVLAGIREQY